MEKPNFNEAVRLLESQIATDVESIKKAAASRRFTVNEMRRYMKRIGLSYDNSNIQNEYSRSIIHVTGTKGKGSTCSIIESIIRHAYGRHTGMFTSPHLVKVTERIRLDGQPISDDEFAEAYMDVRKRLLEFKDNDSGGEELETLPLLPGYFRMITLVALFVFQHHTFTDGRGVDVTILEVGMGGRYDATNVYLASDSVGITLLDYDHTRVLGDTLEKIAWEKGGIIKPNIGVCHSSQEDINGSSGDDDICCVFVSGDNTPGVINVLKQCATEVNTKLKVVRAGEYLDDSWQVGLAGEHQKRNAEVALAVCQAWANKNTTTKMEDDLTLKISSALVSTTWPGRCQSIEMENNIWLRCDGAHTEKSIASCISWFSGVAASSNHRILLFNCSHERNPVTLLKLFVLRSLASKKPLFHQVYFCPSASERPSAVSKSNANKLLCDAGMSQSNSEGTIESERSWQDTLMKVWLTLEKHYDSPAAEKISISKNVATVLNHIREEALFPTKTTTPSNIEILVTGSLLLVGTVLQEVGWRETCAEGKIDVE